jgi:hypothetical protein
MKENKKKEVTRQEEEGKLRITFPQVIVVWKYLANTVRE